jgi:hypothetical protein
MTVQNWIGIALLAVCVLWWPILFLLRSKRNPQSEAWIWRCVVRREQEDQDEIVTLECGHIVRIVNLHRPSFPCAMCQGQIEELKRIHALEGRR